MTITRRRLTALSLGFACWVALVGGAAVGAPATASTDAPAGGGSLTFLRTGPVPLTWDPTDPSSDGVSDPGGTGAYLEAVFGVLAYEDFSSGEVVPSLAESISS